MDDEVMFRNFSGVLYHKKCVIIGEKNTMSMRQDKHFKEISG